MSILSVQLFYKLVSVQKVQGPQETGWKKEQLSTSLFLALATVFLLWLKIQLARMSKVSMSFFLKKEKMLVIIDVEMVQL